MWPFGPLVIIFCDSIKAKCHIGNTLIVVCHALLLLASHCVPRNTGSWIFMKNFPNVKIKSEKFITWLQELHRITKQPRVYSIETVALTLTVNK